MIFILHQYIKKNYYILMYTYICMLCKCLELIFLKTITLHAHLYTYNKKIV